MRLIYATRFELEYRGRAQASSLGELPLLARAGALLALLPPDVDTLARYGDRSASVSLGERERRRVLLAFPRGRSSAALEDGGVELESSELSQVPKTRVPIDEDGATKLMRLIDALEDNDDVDAVHANFDIDADVLERVAG